MTQPAILCEIDETGVATLILNRPKIHNAFDDELIARLTAELKGLAADEKVRAVVLAAEGKSFSAGADVNWMKRMAGYGRDENVRDALALAEMMHTLDRLPKPTVALVQGPAYGGGVGLVAACDIVIAVHEATFAVSEVRLGLIPAVISPYVVRAMGPRAARRYMLTGERFTATEAHRIGLVHEVVPSDELRHAGERMLGMLAENGPQAMAEAKELAFLVAGWDADSELRRETARRIAERRASPEGREGLAAFLEKRKPAWAGET
jgi:methylglutaconyl-CoA hydratase